MVGQRELEVGERGGRKKRKKTRGRPWFPSPYLAASAAGSAAITSPSPPTFDQGATSVATKTTCIAPDASAGADWTAAGTIGAGGGIGCPFWLVVVFLLLRRFFFFLLVESAAPPAATAAAAATLQTATALAGGVADPGFLFQRSGSSVLAAESRLPGYAARAAEAGGRVGRGLLFKTGGDANAGRGGACWRRLAGDGKERIRRGHRVSFVLLRVVCCLCYTGIAVLVSLRCVLVGLRDRGRDGERESGSEAKQTRKPMKKSDERGPVFFPPSRSLSRWQLPQPPPPFSLGSLSLSIPRHPCFF